MMDDENFGDRWRGLRNEDLFSPPPFPGAALSAHREQVRARRERGPWYSPRRSLLAGGVAGVVAALGLGLLLGTNTGYASARVESRRALDQLSATTLDVAGRLARLRIDLARARADLSQLTTKGDAASRPSVLAAQSELGRIEAIIREMDLELTRSAGHHVATGSTLVSAVAVRQAIAIACNTLASLPSAGATNEPRGRDSTAGQAPESGLRSEPALDTRALLTLGPDVPSIVAALLQRLFADVSLGPDEAAKARAIVTTLVYKQFALEQSVALVSLRSSADPLSVTARRDSALRALLTTPIARTTFDVKARVLSMLARRAESDTTARSTFDRLFGGMKLSSDQVESARDIIHAAETGTLPAQQPAPGVIIAIDATSNRVVMSSASIAEILALLSDADRPIVQSRILAGRRPDGATN